MPKSSRPSGAAPLRGRRRRIPGACFRLSALPLAVLAILLLGCAEGEETEVAPKTPPPPAPAPKPARGKASDIDHVIVVSIDSLRRDHLGAYGYGKPTSPTIDLLAKQGLVFDWAYTTTPWTLPSHAAMLTGLDDFAHGVRDHGDRIADEIETLAERLRASGITTTGFFSGPYLDPAFGMNQGFDRYINCSKALQAPLEKGELPSSGAHLNSHWDVTNPLLLEKIGRWSKGKMPGRRNFIFIHMWDVHYDYNPPPRYVKMFDPDYEGSVTSKNFLFNKEIHPGMEPRDLDHVRALYDGEIRYTDDTLGKILKLLQRRGLLRRSAILITADHGQEFFEHGRKGHHATLYDEVMRVPMILSIPGQKPAEPRSEEVVSLIDLYPTVCGLLGVECDPDRRGQDLTRFYREGRKVTGRGDALMELTVKAFALQQTALGLPTGKVQRWRAPQLMRLPDPAVQKEVARRGSDAERMSVLTQFYDRAAQIREDEGLTLREGDDSIPQEAKDGWAALERRAADALNHHEELVRGEGETAGPLDPLLEEHLRSLGYLE